MSIVASQSFPSLLQSDIGQLYQHAAQKKLTNPELEVRLGQFDHNFNPDLNIVTFNRVISYYKKMPVTQITHTVSLDIFLKEVRISVNGLPAIDSYCRKGYIDQPDKVTIIRKRLIDRLDQPEWYYRANLSQEDPIKDRQEVQQYLNQVAQTTKALRYRLKHRYSFQVSPQVRLDFTAIKSGEGLSLARTRLSSEVYQIEMEILFLTDGSQETALKQALETWQQVTKLYLDNPVITSLQQQNEARLEYLRLIGLTDPSQVNISADKTRYWFVGADVMPLGIEHLIHDIEGNYHLKTGYSVTPKADGERFMAMFNEQGHLWLFNNRLQFKYTGFQSAIYKNCLLDGELIVEAGQIRHYLVFDCLWFQGQDIRDQPLYSEQPDGRYDKVKLITGDQSHLKQSVSGNLSFILSAKQYLFAQGQQSILELARQLYIADPQQQLHVYGYHLDGLIFTPYNSPYPRALPGQPIYWPDLLKWKPMNQLSIDFLVDWQESLQEHQQTMDLYVRHRNKLIPFAPLDNQPPFTMTVEKSVKDPVYRTIEQDPIYQKTVIECIYDTSDQQWKPLRYRPDKTDLQAPNSYYTAMSTWNNIQYPVTYKMITGQEAPTDINRQAQEYYLHNKTIMSEIVKPWRDYNNTVKLLSLEHGANLYRQHRNKRALDLLDPACGRGGDLAKWSTIRAGYVLGLDLSESNLEHPVDGAKQRYSQWTRHYPQQVQFVWGNSQRLILTGNAGMDNSSKNLLRTIMAQRGANSFDLVSTQFALHYFTQSEAILRTFLSNVSRNLRIGGYWVGTSFDGQAIMEALRKQESIAGYKVNRLLNKVKIWEITRHWPDTVTKLQPVGQRITVYNINIGQAIDEYLVNYQYLQRLARAFKLELVALVPFKDLDDRVRKRISHFSSKRQQQLIKSLDSMSEDERRVVDFNVYFVFRKVDYLPKYLLELNESNAQQLEIQLEEEEEAPSEPKTTFTPFRPKIQPKPVPKVQPKFVPKVQPKFVPKVQPKPVPKIRPRSVPKKNSKT